MQVWGAFDPVRVDDDGEPVLLQELRKGYQARDVRLAVEEVSRPDVGSLPSVVRRLWPVCVRVVQARQDERP